MGFIVYIILLLFIVLFFGPLLIGFGKYVIGCLTGSECKTDAIFSILNDMFGLIVERAGQLAGFGKTGSS